MKLLRLTAFPTQSHLVCLCLIHTIQCSMGVPGLLKQLAPCQKLGKAFNNPELRKETINFDIAGLAHVGAEKHENDYRNGMYQPSTAFVQQILVYLYFICKWDMFVVFDGMDSPLKAPERERRDQDNKMRNDPPKTVTILDA